MNEAETALARDPKMEPSRAGELARSFALFFCEAFSSVRHMAPGPGQSSSPQNLVFITYGQNKPFRLNHDLAAGVATSAVSARAVDAWFRITGLSRKKHLYSALAVTASTRARAAARATTSSQ